MPQDNNAFLSTETAELNSGGDDLQKYPLCDPHHVDVDTHAAIEAWINPVTKAPSGGSNLVSGWLHDPRLAHAQKR